MPRRFYTAGKSRRVPTDIRHGARSGQWSIRINDQWRVCLRFEDGDAFDVEIVDYH